MPPSIHPVDLIIALRDKHLTPAIVFLTSRRACDEAMQAFDHSRILLPPPRQQAIATVLEKVISQGPFKIRLRVRQATLFGFRVVAPGSLKALF